MYRGFRRSRIVMGVTLALTVAPDGFCVDAKPGGAVYIPVLASVLLLGIGCTAARLLGNITASVACTGMLGILHMDLDPEAFLEQFLPVARRIPGESGTVWSAGFIFPTAISRRAAMLRQSLCWGSSRPLLYGCPRGGVWYADLARAELALGENADEAMEGLRGIIALSGGKAALRKNLQESLSLLEARRDAAAGQPVDREQLEEQLNRAGHKLRSLELLQVSPWMPGTGATRQSAGQARPDAAGKRQNRLPEMGGGVERLRTDIPGSSFGNDKNTL